MMTNEVANQIITLTDVQISTLLNCLWGWENEGQVDIQFAKELDTVLKQMQHQNKQQEEI